jgi:hypothetical protein
VVGENQRWWPLGREIGEAMSSPLPKGNCLAKGTDMDNRRPLSRRKARSGWARPVGMMLTQCAVDAAAGANGVRARQVERAVMGYSGRAASDMMLVGEHIFSLPLVRRGVLRSTNHGGEGWQARCSSGRPGRKQIGRC